MSIASREARLYLWVNAGQFAARSEVEVECVEERGTFYASVNTLNTSPIGTGHTADEAFDAWARRCNNAQPVVKRTPDSGPEAGRTRRRTP